eukprot:1956258-Rhodomonas_salina.1
MALSRWRAALLVLVVLAAAVAAQDDLADYPIKEEQCENFGECLTECVKKLPPNRQFTEIVSFSAITPPGACFEAGFLAHCCLDCSDACAVTHCKEVIVEDPTLGIASVSAPPCPSSRCLLQLMFLLRFPPHQHQAPRSSSSVH